MYGLNFPFPCSRKRLHVSIYIFLKQHSVPAASLPSLPVFQASRLWDQPCQWKMPLSQLSLISWDQLVIAADKWLRGQGSCGESLCQAEGTTGHSPGNSGARLPSYWPFMQLVVDNGLFRKYLRQAIRDVTFKSEKTQKTTAVTWHRPWVQCQTFLDWLRPATYIRLLMKAEQARGGFGRYSSRWLWCKQAHQQKAEATQPEQSQNPKSAVMMLHSWG